MKPFFITGLLLLAVAGCSVQETDPSARYLADPSEQPPADALVLECVLDEVESPGEDPNLIRVQSMMTLARRIDAIGGLDAKVYALGPNRIALKPPEGMSKTIPEELEDQLFSQYLLEFRAVHPDNADLLYQNLWLPKRAPLGYQVVVMNGMEYLEKDPDFTAAYDAELKERVMLFARVDAEHALYLQPVREHDRDLFQPMYINRKPLLTGEAVDSAFAVWDEYSQAYGVTISLTPKGMKRFYTITTDLSPGGKDQHPKTSTGLRRQLAILIGDDLVMSPNVNEPIQGRTAQVSGDFTFEEAARFAAMLNSGTYPVPIRKVESAEEPTI